MDAPEQKRQKADSGAVVTEEQAAEFAAKAQAEGRPRLRILTGDRTTGKLHIGHYVGSLKHRVKYQSLYDTFVLMADVQALTTHYDRPEILKQSVREVALDYMACGIEPYTGGPDDGTKAKIVVQSMVPAIADLTVYYGLLVPVRSLVDNPTVKAEAEQHGYQLEETEDHPELLGDTWQPAGAKGNFLYEKVESLWLKLLNEFPELSQGMLSTGDVYNAVKRVYRSKDVTTQNQITLHTQADSQIEPFLTSTHLRRAVREEILRKEKTRGFTSLTYGFLGYPVSQAADITFVGAHLVPVGPDQVPLIELCREVVHRFNSQYGSRGAGRAAGSGRQSSSAAGDRSGARGGAPSRRILTSPYALLGVREALQGIDGNAKMSKSLNNAIYLSETDAEIWAKVKPAPTDPQRVRRDDPGRPEVCNIFSYHKVFNGDKEPGIDEAALNVASVEEVAENCRGAKWGCVECKQHLCKKLGAILDPMRERRAEWEKRPDDLQDVLKAGTARANEEGEKTLERVRSAMHMDYFSK
jgi:tryptophanyl-tRNA synthetase